MDLRYVGFYKAFVEPVKKKTGNNANQCTRTDIQRIMDTHIDPAIGK